MRLLLKLMSEVDPQLPELTTQQANQLKRWILKYGHKMGYKEFTSFIGHVKLLMNHEDSSGIVLKEKGDVNGRGGTRICTPMPPKTIDEFFEWVNNLQKEKKSQDETFNMALDAQAEYVEEWELNHPGEHYGDHERQW